MRVDILAGIIAIALLLIAATVPADAEDPAFDCSKAEHEIEKLICQDDALAAKDRKLAEVYQQALSVLDGVADKEEATNYLKAYQRGWVGGRNDCWKADDKAKCTSDAYDMRIAELQARYFLVKGGDPVFYLCDDNSEIVATFIPTDLPTVRLERGDSLKVGLLTPAASGSKYEADFGTTFWVKGDEAVADWAQGEEVTCKVRS